MPERRIKIIFMSLIMISASGCVTYMEQTTPSGTVPRLTERPAAHQPSSVQEREFMPTTPLRSGRDVASVIERFRATYEEVGKPRITLYVNRELSDEVRLWSAQERVVLEGRGQYEADTSDNESTEATRKSGAASLAVTKEYAVHEPSRDLVVEEYWLSAFEEGFVEMLVRGNARLVDRSAILRLAAHGQQQVKVLNDVDAKLFEIEAFKDYTDIVVEVLMAEAQPLVGHINFRAVAKAVESGETLALATTADLRPSMYYGGGAVATSDGYQLHSSLGPSEAKLAAEGLALELMQQLGARWSEDMQ